MAKAQHTIKVCPQCSREYSCFRRVAHKRVYCSPKCQADSRIGKTGPARRKRILERSVLPESCQRLSVDSADGSVSVLSIPIAGGHEALIDPEDFDKVNAINWSMHGTRLYAVGRDRLERRPVSMHRLVMDAKPGELVDHKDGNGLHNWKGNLRICTNAENTRNRRAKPSGRSGFRGVAPVGKSRFSAAITCDYKTHYLGCFASAEDAARAYDSAAVKYFGEFASLNLPNIREFDGGQPTEEARAAAEAEVRASAVGQQSLEGMA